MRAQLDAAGALLRRDWLIFVSYRIRLVTTLLGTIFSLTLFYYVSRLVTVEPFDGPDDYYAFAVVGLLILAVLNSVLGGPPGIVRQELVAGTFERLYLSPFGPVGGLLSMLLFPFAFSLLIATLSLLFAAIAFGLDVQWATAALAFPLSALGALAFVPFGIALLALVLLVKQAASGATWVVAFISLISGLYFPTTLLPGWIEWLSDVQPFTPTTELLRHVLVDTPMRDSVGVALLKLAGFTSVLLPASVWILGRAIDAGRRRGTLTEF